MSPRSRPSARIARASSSYAARGVLPPVRTTSPPCRTALSSIAAHARAGSSSTSISRLTAQPPRRVGARDRRSGRAAAPAGRPRPRIPPSPREAPSTRQLRSPPSTDRSCASSPPGARSSESEAAGLPADGDPGQAGRLLIERRQRQLDRGLAGPGRRRPAPSVAVARLKRRDRPIEPRREPAGEERRARARAGAVADADLVQSLQRGQPPGRVEAGRQALAPGRRPQPRQVDDVHGAQQVSRRASRPAVSCSSSESTRITSILRSSASIASSWPCGDHSTVGSSATSTGSTIVSSRASCSGPDVDLDASRASGGSRRPAIRRSSSSRPRRSSRGPPRPRTGSCARRGSAPPARAGWRSRPSTGDRPPRPGSEPAPAPARGWRRGACAAARVTRRRSRPAWCPALPRRLRSSDGSVPRAHRRRHLRPSSSRRLASSGPSDPAGYCGIGELVSSSQARQDRVDDPPQRLDLVVAGEQRRVAAHRVEDQPLVRLG